MGTGDILIGGPGADVFTDLAQNWTYDQISFDAADILEIQGQSGPADIDTYSGATLEVSFGGAISFLVTPSDGSNMEI